LSKVVEFKDFTLFRGITTQDVKGHLIERRKIYMRVCELANHPNIIGFLQSSCKIWCIGRLQNKFHVRCLIEDKEMKQPSITHACGHLKKRRPPSIPSVHICTKQSSP